MTKFLTCIILVITLLATSSSGTKAQEDDTSGVIKSTTKTADYDYRVESLKRFLEKFDSPLSPYATDIVKYADVNGLDYRLVPAISGVESTFGKNIPANSYNAYGWANGDFSFKSWQDSINIVSNALKTNYIEKGAGSISKIARRYAPPSKSWGSKVKYFVSRIDTLPLNFDII